MVLLKLNINSLFFSLAFNDCILKITGNKLNPKGYN